MKLLVILPYLLGCFQLPHLDLFADLGGSKVEYWVAGLLQMEQLQVLASLGFQKPA